MLISKYEVKQTSYLASERATTHCLKLADTSANSCNPVNPYNILLTL